MASAIQLTAASSIVNGQGIATSANLLSQISTFKAQAPIVLIANVFATAANANASISGNLVNALSKLGLGVTHGQWLIDLYPANITPVCSTNVVQYSNANVNTSSFSGTVRAQAQAPFAYGMASFANTFQTAYSYAALTFDTVSSVNLLQSKTYAQSGIGYTGPSDLISNGIDANAPLIANVISTWGTMYDIKNINSIGNPYVFGQNILNRQLGNYGNLSVQLAAAGLNTNNLLQVPQSSTTTAPQITTTTRGTTFGPITLPSVTNVTTTNLVLGNSTGVVLSIYGNVTGANLQAITTATKSTIANVSITNLADYLNLNKVVTSSQYTQLGALGIVDFYTLGEYLQARIGQGNFNSWTDLANFLLSIVVPTLSYTTANANATVLSSNTISTLNSITGTGTGPFGNPVMCDYLGAATGIPYTSLFTTLNTNYVAAEGTLLANVTTLDAAVTGYIGNANITPVQNAVTAINSTLTALSSTALTSGQTAYYKILNKITNEITNLTDAGVTFGSGTAQMLENFAQRIGALSSDATQFQTYQFFGNLVTSDVYGDTIKSATAESINNSLFAARGITLDNDPNPARALAQAQLQNIPLTTYLSQNK